jgi:heme/copper-type cytochrome/quinol oxidase subunit 3
MRTRETWFFTVIFNSSSMTRNRAKLKRKEKKRKEKKKYNIITFVNCTPKVRQKKINF